MRISGGSARGIQLRVPKGVRPASERVRQAVFTSLGPQVDDARVLDLYCGSGAYGLEALSRGAASADFVDADRRCLDVARDNAERAGFTDEASFHRVDAAAFARRGGSFDLVFIDPPYTDPGGAKRVLAGLAASLAPGAVVVLEMRSSDADPPEGASLMLEDDRRYGDTRVLMYIHHAT